MKKVFINFAVCMSFIVFSNGIAISKGDTDLGPEDIILKTLEGKKPAEFPHRQHQETIVCLRCHHVDGKQMTTQECMNCHNGKFKNSKLNSFKKAAHLLCRTCHKQAKEEGNDAPTKCSGCHGLKMKK